MLAGPNLFQQLSVCKRLHLDLADIAFESLNTSRARQGTVTSTKSRDQVLRSAQINNGRMHKGINVQSDFGQRDRIA